MITGTDTLEPMGPCRCSPCLCGGGSSSSTPPQNRHQPESVPFQAQASQREQYNIMLNSCKTPGTTFIAKKPFAQWYGLMKTYYKKHEEKCKVADELKRNEVKHYPTGSSYKGAVGMSGYGEYTYPNGVVYQGNFYDGCFHGDGKLIFHHGPEANSVIQGQWVNGVLTESKILFDGKLEYDPNDWMYCKLPDRRYTMEFEQDPYPDDEPLITPENLPRTIPPGYYDTGDGFYHPPTKLIYNHDILEDVQRAPSAEVRKWIRDNCRKEPMGTLGPHQALYEKWVDPIVEPEPLPQPSIGFHKSNFKTESLVSTNEVVHPVVYDPKW